MKSAQRSDKVTHFTSFDINRSITLAKNIRFLRESRGLSLERLSDELDRTEFVVISKSSLMNYEVTDQKHPKFGKNLGMSAQYLHCIADYFNVSIDWLFGLTADPSKTPCAADELPLSQSTIDILSKMNKNIRENKDGKDFIWAVLINDLIDFGLDASVLVNYLCMHDASDMENLIASPDSADAQESAKARWSNESSVKELGFYPLSPREASEFFRSQLAFQFQTFLKTRYPAKKEG